MSIFENYINKFLRLTKSPITLSNKSTQFCGKNESDMLWNHVERALTLASFGDNRYGPDPTRRTMYTLWGARWVNILCSQGVGRPVFCFRTRYGIFRRAILHQESIVCCLLRLRVVLGFPPFLIYSFARIRGVLGSPYTYQVSCLDYCACTS